VTENQVFGSNFIRANATHTACLLGRRRV